jgi:hypothetical protein
MNILANSTTGMTEVTEALTTSFTAIGSNVTSILVIALPIALGVVGMVIAVRFGIKWFRSLVR